MTTVLNINQIFKSFGKTEVLKDVSLEINQGETIALLGQSGSGKTTLLRIIAGLEQANSGSITFNETVWQSETIFIEPQDRSIGFVFQNYALFPHLSVAQNILFGTKASKNQLNDLLYSLQLSELSERYPHELSGGQQQRVALARAIVRKPALLLMDEPFSSLDEHLKDQLRSNLKQTLSKLGITTIIVTHDSNDAFYLADKIALLNNGKIEQFDTPINLYQNPKNTIVASFFGKVNELVINNKQVVFRPENASIEESGTYNAIVASSIFQGKHYVIEAKHNNTTIFIDNKSNITKGTDINFNINKVLES